DRTVAEATGNPTVCYTDMLREALRGDEQSAKSVIDAGRTRATADGQGRIVTFADYAEAVLYNGLGRHDLACDAARRGFGRAVVGGYQVLAVAELAEAASRTGEDALLERARSRMAERARATPTDLALGIDARLEALSGNDGSEARYRASLDHLGRTAVSVEV